MMEEDNKYYLYRHIRLDKNEPFYIGIGRKESNKEFSTINQEYRRAFRKDGRNSLWTKIYKKAGYKVEILLESNNYDFIKTKEIEFINLYGRLNLNTGILANLTDGGEENKGQVITEEMKKRISDTLKGREGKKHTEECKKRMSEVQKRIAVKGRRISIETEFKKGQLPHNCKKVLDLDTNITFISLTAYRKFYNIPETSFNRGLKNNKYNIKICA